MGNIRGNFAGALARGKVVRAASRPVRPAREAGTFDIRVTFVFDSCDGDVWTRDFYLRPEQARDIDGANDWIVEWVRRSNETRERPIKIVSVNVLDKCDCL